MGSPSSDPPSPEPSDPPSAARSEAADGQACRAWIDLWHHEVESWVMRAVERADRFFADERLDEEHRDTRLLVRVGGRWERNKGPSAVSDVRLRLALPNLKKRLYLFMDDVVSVDEPSRATALSEAVQESHPFAGIRHVLGREGRLRLNTDGGVRWGEPPQGFARMRLRGVISGAKWRLALVESVSWFSRDGWIETSEATWNWPMRSQETFRSVTRLTWEEQRSGLTPSQSFSWLRQTEPRGGWRVTVAGIWPESPHTQEAKYTALFAYRRMLHRPWLFLEVSPGVEFPQATAYQVNPFLVVSCDVVFGGRGSNRSR